MRRSISVIMPAFRAGATVAASVASVLAQTHAQWELLLVSDDGSDYQAQLAQDGISDPRLRFLSTGRTGSGSSNARNIALEVASSDFVAILDADDRFHPEKLERVMAALRREKLVSTALRVTDAAGNPLRLVGAGPDRVLDPGEHKWVNLSMDSMLAYDRRAADPRYDVAQPCLTDLDFLLKLLAHIERSLHLGAPLHDYVKLPVSVSNGPGVAERMVAMKRLLIGRLETGYYRLADAQAADGFLRFLEVSLEAETRYEAALAARPGLLFEDHLEPMLRATATSAA